MSIPLSIFRGIGGLFCSISAMGAIANYVISDQQYSWLLRVVLIFTVVMELWNDGVFCSVMIIEGRKAHGSSKVYQRLFFMRSSKLVAIFCSFVSPNHSSGCFDNVRLFNACHDCH
jgi:hypothetical protein